MNNFTEQERIEQFKNVMAACMPYRFHYEFVDMLRDMGFLQHPLQFITTGLTPGRCSITV